MIKRSLLLAFGLSLSLASAQEHVDLPFTVGHLATRDGKVYEGAIIVGQDDVGVKIQHDGGTARILYNRLPDDLAKQFSVEAQEGKAHQDAEAQKRKDAADAARQAADDAARKAADEAANKKGYVPDAPPSGGTTAPAAPPAPVLTQDPDILAKIAPLEAYIRKLQKGIDDSKIAMDKARRRAKELRSRSEFAVIDSNGDSAYGVNGSVVAKANFQDNLADKEQAKINEAERLIAETQRKIDKLQATPPPAPKPVKPAGA